MASPSWLKTAAQRSGQQAWTLGHVFNRYREIEGRSPEQLLEELGCSLEVLHWLSLCRRPDGEQFVEHTLAIAKRFVVDPHRLAEVIRRVEVVDALAAGPGGAEATHGRALLLAARDRPDEEETSS